jgi:ribosomal protein S6--L-glutamate ligase/gamma-F420-2:alpha-L-glutamate ligase
MLEGCGLRLFNSAEGVEVCDDKMRTYLAFRGKGIPVPKSIPAPLCYTPNAQPSVTFLRAVEKELGFPLVAKKSYGSFGMGVQLVHGALELQKMEQEWLYAPHFYQEYIEESAGRDIRVIVIGGKAVASMERVAQKGEFRSNIELGGTGRAIHLDTRYVQVAENAAKALGLDYCGVDLLEGKNGAIVCEVNSNAFFEGIEVVTGINVAKAYAKHILASFS